MLPGTPSCMREKTRFSLIPGWVHISVRSGASMLLMPFASAPWQVAHCPRKITPPAAAALGSEARGLVCCASTADGDIAAISIRHNAV